MMFSDDVPADIVTGTIATSHVMSTSVWSGGCQWLGGVIVRDISSHHSSAVSICIVESPAYLGLMAVSA